MNLRLWTLIMVLFLSYFAKAQKNIQGKIVDSETKANLSDVNLSFFNGLTSQLIEKKTTDSLGRFSFKSFPEGLYVIVEKRGYQTKRLDTFREISVIEMIPSGKTIEEIVLQSPSRNIKLNDGNTVMNIAGNKDFKTATHMLDVLRKTPGVTVDQEDGIFIGGRMAPAIFINGKPVVMSIQETQAYLRSLSPEMVESIEINTNPSSKYDAEFKGIIDIRLKRNANLGWKGNYNGNISVNKFNYRENSLTLSYNTEKIAYQMQMGYNEGISTYRYNALQRLANTNVMRTETYQKDAGEVTSVLTGIDYRLNSKNRLRFTLRGNFRNNNRARTGSLYTTNEDETHLIFNTESNNPTDYSQENYGISTDYSWRSKNFEVNFLGNYLRVNNKQKDDFINKKRPDYALLSYWKSDLSNRIKIYTAQLDVRQKVRNTNFEAGIKYGNTETSNNIRYDTLALNNQFVPDPTRSNMFLYKEEVFAGYVTFSRKLNKLQINGGIRFENTKSISDAISSDSVVARNYVEWLSSFGINYTFNKSNEISVSYSRKITRPIFSQLNPFRFYFSPLNYWIGNPYLQPSFTSQIKATYRYKNWVTDLTIGKETDVMVRYPRYDPKTNVLEYLGTNLPYRNFAILEMSFPIKITKWWNINTQITGYYNYEFRPYFNEVFAFSIYNYELRFNQVFSLHKGYTVNLFTNYESKTGNSLYIIKPRYTVDLSIQKTWFDNKLNTKISYNNMFDSYDQRLVFRHKQIIDNQFTHWWDSRRFLVAVSYNFGSSKYQGKEIQKTDEENRTR